MADDHLSAEVRLENERLAARLEEFAALLELGDAETFSVRAYRRAAAALRTLPVSAAELVRTGRVRDLRGVGPGIERRLRELVETGELAEAARLRQERHLELAALGQMLGLGARRGAAIAEALNIESAAELREAAREGRLRDVPGIGAKTEARIRAALAAPPRTSAGLTLPRARAALEPIASALGGVVAGDVRRWLDEPRRLAIFVVSGRAADVRERFAALPEIVSLLDPGRGLSVEGLPIELVVAGTDDAGRELIRATGPASYVAGLEPLPTGRDEESVYRALRLPYLAPELRGLWEGGAAPPALVELADLRGDLHCHTRWSDGRATVLEMGEAARTLGYDYLAICDHTPHVRVVQGLDGSALRRQAEEIAEANALLAPFRLLRGVECDIRPDGSLDLDDAVLAELEWVQLSLHAGQRAPRREVTARVTEAMRHPAVRCLSHPTGRLIGYRPENALDLERTLEVARETGVALEVNGLPNRLDLRGEHVRRALEAGVDVVCSTDAHSAAGLAAMELAVHTARRGGATAAAVVNTRPLSAILKR